MNRTTVLSVILALIFALTLTTALMFTSCQRDDIDNDDDTTTPTDVTEPTDPTDPTDINRPGTTIDPNIDPNEVTELDFVFVTNASSSVVSRELREGDEFLGLTLETIEFSNVKDIANGIDYTQINSSVHFSGDLVLSGSLDNNPSLWDSIVFVVDDMYYGIIPQFAGRSEPVTFVIRNSAELSDMLDEDNVTLRIANLNFMRQDGVTVSYADFVETVNTVPHPFALAVREYFDGATAVAPHHYELPVAFMVDVDGNGTAGVFAVRHEATENWTFAFGRLFYMYNDEVRYYDFGAQDPPTAVNITRQGRIVYAIGDAGQALTTFFELHEGELVESFAFELENGAGNRFFRWDYTNGENPVRQRITEEEYLTYLSEHASLPWWRLDDESSEILAMYVLIDAD